MASLPELGSCTGKHKLPNCRLLHRHSQASDKELVPCQKKHFLRAGYIPFATGLAGGLIQSLVLHLGNPDFSHVMAYMVHRHAPCTELQCGLGGQTLAPVERSLVRTFQHRQTQAEHV
jgi:hypothetical protein